MLVTDTIRELLEKQKEDAAANPDSEYRHIGIINRCDDALAWLEKFVERKLYIEDDDIDDNFALAILLQDEIVFCNSISYGTRYYITQYVLCNDIFAWGMADAEHFSSGDIEDLYKMYTADKGWGAAKWCCIHRNMQPQDPVKRDGHTPWTVEVACDWNPFSSHICS